MAPDDRSDIERVRAATDIADLIGAVTKIKRSGRSMMAVCPFHQEKTPSMSVDRAQGLYHCFGCGKSGDVFTFVQETQGLGFADALEMLARRAGITITRDPAAEKRRTRRQALVDATAIAVAFYEERLLDGPDAGGARKYLRGRGYDRDVVKQFSLGYSPAAGSALLEHLRSREVPDRIAMEAGLVMRGRGGMFDRFRGRLMFPIFDLRGDPVGFGARLLEGDGPKYLNSPETPIYHKSRLLYGLNWAKSEIVRRGESVVVEGYTDVIAFHQTGRPVAVATCGTALGADHLDLLRRFDERVVLMFDSDDAGTGASLRGFDQAIPGDLDLRVALLPEGRDPADVVSAGDADLLSKAIEDSVPLLRFTLDNVLARYDIGEAEGRGRAVRAAVEVIKRHPDPVTQGEYAVEVARKTGVEVESIRSALFARSPAVQPPPRRQSHPEKLSGQQKAEREMLRLVMAGQAGDTVDESLFTDTTHVEALRLLGPVLEGAEVAAVIGSDTSEAGALLRRLAADTKNLPDRQQVVTRLQAGRIERRIDEIERKLQNSGGAAEGASGLLEELIALQKDRRDLWSPD